MATQFAILGFRFKSPRFYVQSSLSNPSIPVLFPSYNLRVRTNPKFRTICSSFVVNNAQQEEEEQEIRFTDEENRLIQALIGVQGRGRSASPLQLKEVERAVQVLEDLTGVPDPTNSSLIEGCWQLMFTTRPGSASPIQEVYLRTDDPRVSNIVKFSDAVGELKVEAVASIRDGKRIIFQFDRAAFSLKFLPFKVPYPVPFRLLGDEAKGWLDTTYLSHSGNIRISRGNKGTTFVLQKETQPQQKLLSAISTGTGVREAIDKLVSTNLDKNTAEPELLEGEWKMIWSSQTETDSWLENAANGLMGTQVIRKNGQLRFLVDILFGFRFSMSGTYRKTGSKMYEVTMDDAAIVLGSFGLPMEIQSRFNLELLYADEKIRITRGYNNIIFVHLCANKS